MNPQPKTDVVIVGMGAAGGIASYVLTKAGLNVVGLEAGPRLSRTDFLKQLDEIGGAYLRNQLGAPKWNHEVPTWRHNPKEPATQNYAASGMANLVGGTSIHYSTQSWRLRADDFTQLSTTVKRYGKQAIPAGSTMVDWPVTYDDVEPYYQQTEELIGVSGKGGANPFESPRKKDFPMPPLRYDGFSELVAKAMTDLGYHPFPKPAAITSEPYRGRPACTYCGFCTAFGCWNDSKSSTLVTAIADAEKTGKLQIRSNSRVMKVLSNDKGQATGVQYLDDNGQLQEQPAGVVVLSSYLFENIRLLFLSRSATFPEGLANKHGQVGKNFMAHLFTSTSGFYPDQHINAFGGALVQGPGMDDLDGDNFDHTGLGFIRGSLVFPVGNTESLPISASRSVPPGTPTWGATYKQWLKQHANTVIGMFGQGEFLPYETNYLDLDPKTTDRLGVPVVRITYDAHENEQRLSDYVATKLLEIHKRLGAAQSWSVPLAAILSPVNTHAYGGARMGDDPSMSVVDQYSLAHEVPNLAVLGGATFCSTSGYNPTLTIQALAWRSCEHIAKNFNTIAAG